MVPPEAAAQFGRDPQRQRDPGPRLASALAKGRGQALRLSLVLELLWWCAEEGFSPPPTRITVPAFAAAATLMREYFGPMAARVYGEHAATPRDGNAATLARWILSSHAREVHVRHLQREVRLSGLRRAGEIEEAAAALIAHYWLFPSEPREGLGPRPRHAYRVNPLLQSRQSRSVIHP